MCILKLIDPAHIRLYSYSFFDVFIGQAWAEAGLKAHNIFRKMHEAPDMKLNMQMCSEAEAYAKDLAARGAFEHSKSKDGENLAMGCSSQQGQDMTAEEATKNW